MNGKWNGIHLFWCGCFIQFELNNFVCILFSTSDLFFDLLSMMKQNNSILHFSLKSLKIVFILSFPRSNLIIWYQVPIVTQTLQLWIPTRTHFPHECQLFSFCPLLCCDPETLKLYQTFWWKLWWISSFNLVKLWTVFIFTHKYDKSLPIR